MTIETREKFREIKKLGNIEVERTPDGKILRINEVELQEGDKILLVQRHQKPGPFIKEQLLKSVPEGIKDLSNLDYAYEPQVTEAGSGKEEKLLSGSLEALGKMDLVATTPRKRGSEHKELLKEKFPDAKEDESINKMLDDSGLGLMGESFYGGYKYTLEESRKLFKPSLTKALRFGKGPYEGERKPFSYMETWVNLGYLKPENRWKVESPEELCERTEKLLDQVKEKNYFITHEANCVAFHMLAERKPEDLHGLLDKIDLPSETRETVNAEITESESILNIFKKVKQSLAEHPVKGYHYRKVLKSLLENIKLESGEKGKGYGSMSVYVLREDEKGEKILLEAAYDEQV